MASCVRGPVPTPARRSDEGPEGSTSHYWWSNPSYCLWVRGAGVGHPDGMLGTSIHSFRCPPIRERPRIEGLIRV